eukprot:5872278-Pleurochrysis_carterae.AAC.1
MARKARAAGEAAKRTGVERTSSGVCEGRGQEGEIEEERNEGSARPLPVGRDASGERRGERCGERLRTFTSGCAVARGGEANCGGRVRVVVSG